MKLTQALVVELTDYCKETGKLFWKDRGRHWFNTNRAWLAFNGRIGGRELKPGYHDCKFLDTSQQKNRLVWLRHTGSLPNGHLFKVITVNRNVFDKRIENLVCVPTSIATRQPLSRKSKRNKPVGLYGVYWDARSSRYTGSYIDTNGSQHYKNFEDLHNAVNWRVSHEYDNRYWNLDGLTTGDKYENCYEEPVIEKPHYWITPKVSTETRARMSASHTGRTGKNSSRYMGPIIGSDVDTREKLVFNSVEEMNDKGFAPSNIYKCINQRRKDGKRYTYRNYEWDRLS